MADDEELREAFPSSDEGSADESVVHAQKKTKTESSAELAWENSRAAGLHGRKPVELALTTAHDLVLGKTFGSRSAAPFMLGNYSGFHELLASLLVVLASLFVVALFVRYTWRPPTSRGRPLRNRALRQTRTLKQASDI
jgi:hypothetical protein